MISSSADIPIRSVLDSMRRLVRALHVYSRESERNFGLSAAQLFVLQNLGIGAGLSMSQLAHRTLTDMSSVSVVVSRLHRKGLVLKGSSPLDGRTLQLRLSPQGRRVLGRIHDPLQSRLVQAMAAMPLERIQQGAAFLDDVLLKSGISRLKPRLFFEKEDE